MKHAWQLNYTDNLYPLHEACLTLVSQRSGNVLRCWAGPLAGRLMQRANRHLGRQIDEPTVQLTIDKQLAQHLLIEASLQHQYCLHHYRVAADLSRLPDNLAGAEDMLLYLRMTTQHPAHQTLIRVMNLTQPDNHRCDELLTALTEHKLIQKITCAQMTFYDKNPWPHNHLFDPVKRQVFDYHRQLADRDLKLIRG